MMPLISIHTATYNRAYILEQAYKSLLSQTCHDFEWVVSDDGSSDDTESLVTGWIKDNPPFPIVYNKCPRGGIPRTMNSGVSMVKGKYFFMLDSDDELLPNCVETIISHIHEIEDKSDFVGLGFVIVTRDGQPVKKTWPKVNSLGYVDCTNLERKYYDLDADMRELYKTDILQKYPFQVWPTEIYAPEQLCFDGMALDGYKIRWYSKPVYVCEYRDDGQTKGAWNLQKRNKMGYAMLANQQLLYRKGFVNLFKSAAEHIALSILGKNPGYILKTNKWWLTLLAIPYALLLTIRRAIQFTKDAPN